MMQTVTEASPRAEAGAGRVGRLADPGLAPATDPRLHPGVRAGLAAFGLDAAAPPPPISPEDDPASIQSFLGETHAGFEGLYAAVPKDWPGESEPALTRETLSVPDGTGGGEILLHLTRPSDVSGPLPCVVYLHGGGMVILDADNVVHRQWSADLAATGLVVIVVDYRNAWSPEGPQPFPAGLDDCTAAVSWIDQHRDQFGITKIVLQGDSGGANLALATALRAKREGTIDTIAGVYALDPYISGGYGWPDDRKLNELPSLIENDGYFLNCKMLHMLVVGYDPTGANAENPLAWPYFATETDVQGLPPHVIAAAECDPLRDEGLAYARLLQNAGVETVGKVNLGMTHIANMLFRQSAATEYRDLIGDIHRFATTL